jgi:hypothetical protein
MQKWEYCAIIDVGGKITGPSIHTKDNSGLFFFTRDGAKSSQFKAKNIESIAQVIAYLGQEGWEMSGCGNTGDAFHHIYFKRPLEE